MSKDNKTFRDNLKHILRSFSKGSLNNVVSRSDIVLSEEIEQDVRKESSMSTRLKAFKELAESLNGNKLEDKATEKLWFHVEDLLQKHQTKEVRSEGFHFLKTLIKTQSEQLNVLRGHFFRVIKDMEDPDDALDRFELLNCLTENGKNVLYFEEEIGPFMLKWMKNMSGFSPGKIQEFLLLLVNIIKFNAGYLDEQIITGIIRQVYTVCFFPAVLVCLQVLDTIVCYSYIPTESLSDFIGILCHTVNGEVYCQNSAKVMRNLLGTYMGHSTINKLCTFLREPMFQKNELLLRGAICFTSMALWGHNHIQSLLIHQNTVLLSFIDVLKAKEQLVTFEIILNVQRLVYKHGHELHDPVWDSVLTILQLVSELIDRSESENKKLNADMSKYLYDSMTCIDKLIENNQFNGSIKKFFSIVANNSKKKPNHLIHKLIMYLSSSVTPIKPDWLKNLKLLLKVFLIEEQRPEIQLKALEVLKDVFIFNKLCYEKELFDEIICPCFQKLPIQMETDVKIEITIFLISSISNYDSKHCSSVLSIIEQISELSISSCRSYAETANELNFIHVFIKSLIELFSIKLYHYPASNAARIFCILVRHLDFQYQVVNDYQLADNIRYDLLDFFLKIRANLNGLCGICRKKGIIKYSAFLKIIDERETNFPQLAAEVGKTAKPVDHISLRKPFILFITCLNKEIATRNILLVLNEITELLQNRAISISKLEKNEIDMLVLTSFALITENRLKTFDLHDSVFMLLANLTSFHEHLNENRQESIINFLIKFGLVSKRVMSCLIALTACAVEIKDSIVVFLPEILLALSKISPTVYISIPVLEFLSTLIRHSSLYSNFACDQYMYVFAISLPYTNPFKYNHYIVSLAHHVIAVWFLKCQLSYRRDFVKFITTGLQSNVLNQFNEESIRNFTEKSFINEDSSNRKRSSSLTEQSYRRNEYSRMQPKIMNSLSTMSSPKPSIKVIGDSVLVQFYEELTETCIDLMARYTYSPCSPLPTRSPVTEFLLKNGNSQTWLIGNKIITITTSGCAQTVSKNGLCEKCRLFCGKIDEKKGNRKHVQFNTAETEEKTNEKQMDVISETVEKLILQSKCDNLEKSPCACWCQGWAEIYIRRPTGDTAWTLKIQNSINYQTYKHDFPLQDLSTLYMESLTKNQFINSSDFDGLTLKRRSSDESSNYNINDGSSAIESLLESKTRNPVRRSNSSPEMSSSWKNPFLANTNVKGSQNSNIGEESEANSKKKNYQHDLRVSWEAIPEEIAGSGTTPPLFDQMKNGNPVLTDDESSLILSETSVEVGKPPKMKKFNTNSKTDVILTCLSPMTEATVASVSASASAAELVVVAAAASASETAKNTWTHETDGGRIRVDSKGPISSAERPTSLPSFTSNVANATSKPPQNSILMKAVPPICENIVLSPISRDRGHTISVMSPARIQRKESVKNAPVTANCDFLKSGINPSFIFLQLYHSSVFGPEKPLLVSSNNSDVFERSLKVLDRMPPFETHKVGVVYVGVNQCHSETEILRNRFGSLRYLYFLNGLGSMISLTNVDPRTCYLGGLECNGDHGKFAYSWQDDVMQVIFHVATLMPCKDNDPRCTNKKMHIGNNYVTIVYNESGDDYNFGTINSQFNYVSIVIVPMDHKTNKIIIKAKNDLSKQMGFSEPRIVSDDNLAVLVRQLALHANLVSMISKSLTIKGGEPYASNWLERLRKIKATRQKLLLDNNSCDSHSNLVSNASSSDSSKNANSQIDDFTSYT